MAGAGALAPAGWYPDPRGRFRLRYFDGRAWTDDVVARDDVTSTAPATSRPATPGAAARLAAERSHLAYVLQFLAEELDGERLPFHVYRALRDDAQSRLRAAATPATPTPTPTPSVAPVETARVRPPATVGVPLPESVPAAYAAVTTAPVVPVAPVGSTPAARSTSELPSWRAELADFVARVSATVRSDLAVHGLAYLGVLLFFAGVFGFVVFAFGEVSTDLRPVAEVAIPVAVFGAAAFLSRRGSRFVAAALELLGGTLVPIVVVASFADGADVPPDAHGDALATGLGVAMVVVAIAYALVARRRAESPLRYLVAPVLWLGVALAASPTVAGAGHGSALARPSAWQMAVTALAVFVTAVVARWARDRVVATATELVVLPGLAVVTVLEVVGLARDGWPGWPIVVTGLAVLATVEVQAPRLPASGVVALQAAAVVAAAIGVGLEVDAPWGAAVAAVALVAVGEWNGARRPTALVPVVTLVPAGCAIALAFQGDWAAVVAAGVLTMWALVRRVVHPGWLQFDQAFADFVAVVVSVAFGAALVDALGPSTGLVVVAAVLAAASLVVRATPARHDPMWSWALPAADVAMVVAVLVATSEVGSTPLCVAAALLGIAAATSTGPLPVRIWIAAAAWTTAVGLLFDVAGVTLGTASAALAVAGLLLVGVSVARRGVAPAHLGAVGVVTGAATIVTASAGHALANVVVVFACGTVAWIAGAVAEERAGWSTADMVAARTRAGVRFLPAGFALVGLVGTTLVALRAGADSTLPRAVVAWVLAGGALVGAAAARVLRHRPLTAPSLTWAGTGLGLVGLAVAEASSDALTAGIAAAVALSIVVVLPAERRGWVLPWIGWTLTGVATVSAAFASGLAHDHAEVALFAWGAVVAVAALAFDDVVAGRRARGEVVRDPRALAPTVLGLLALVVAAAAATDASRDALGWWALAGAGVVLVLAVQLRQAVLSTASYALLVPAVALLAPGVLPDDPWSLVVLASAEVLAAVVLAITMATPRALPERWDLPPFAVGNAVALAVAVMAFAAKSPLAVYLVMGLWSLAVAAAVRTRLHQWAAIWVVAGVALLDVAAGRAGPPWLTGAFVITSVVATVVAGRSTGPARPSTQTAGALAALGAGIAALWWWDPSRATAVAAAGVVAGLLALVVVALVRWARVSSDWLAPWGGVAVVVMVAAGDVAVDMAAPRAGLGVAVGVALFALASALAAAPLRMAALRVLAAILVAGALAIALVAVEASLDAAAVVAGTTGFVAVVIAATLAARRPASVWLQPALALAALGVGGAVGLGIADLPHRELLVAALALAGAAAAVVGVALGRVTVLACAPVLLCASWLVFASDALTGSPQWFTVPVGITLLVVEGLLRAALRARGDDPHTPTTLGLDYAGMAFLVGASIVQIVVTSEWYVLPAIGLGAALGAWGAVTRVVHRSWFGAGTVVLALLVAVALPAVQLVPQLEGAELWISIAALGLAALFVAAILEQGRRRAETGIARLRDLTSGWER